MTIVPQEWTDFGSRVSRVTASVKQFYTKEADKTKRLCYRWSMKKYNLYPPLYYISLFMRLVQYLWTMNNLFVF